MLCIVIFESFFSLCFILHTFYIVQQKRQQEKKTMKENWNRKVYHSQVLEKVTSVPRGATCRGQDKVQARSGAHAFIRVYGWSALGFPG